MPFMIVYLTVFLYPLSVFSQSFVELNQQKIHTVIKLLEQNQLLILEDSSSILLTENEVISSYEELLETAESTLKLSEEIDKQEILYPFFINTEPHVHELKSLEEKQQRFFTLFLETAESNNQNQSQKENFINDLQRIQNQRGRLSHKELSDFMRIAMQEDNQTGLSLEDRLKQVIDWISLAYEQIDQKREQLLQQSHLFAHVLCDSQVYRSSYKGDCVSIVRDKKELTDFLDSISPKKWQELEGLFKNTKEYEMFSRVFDPGIALTETLWVLYNQIGIYDSYNLAFQQADFYRWMYFTLRNKIQKGDQKEVFYWEGLWDELNQEQKTVETLNSQELDFLMNDLVIQAEKDRLSKLILETQTQYFDTLNMVSIFFDIQLGSISIDSFCQDLSIVQNRQPCFQEILDGVENQEQKIKDLKIQRDKNRQRIVYYAPLIIQQLKSAQP